MTDYISREAAISASWKALYEYEDEMEKRFMEDPELDISDWFFHRIHVQMFHARLLDVLTNLHAADVRPNVNGRWVHLKSANTDQRICTACQHTQPITGLMNYCPVCGADMIGESRERDLEEMLKSEIQEGPGDAG